MFVKMIFGGNHQHLEVDGGCSPQPAGRATSSS